MASTPDLEANQFTEEDRRYKGSRFSEVVAALGANPYQRVWAGAGEPLLPGTAGDLANRFRGASVIRARPILQGKRADARFGC